MLQTAKMHTNFRIKRFFRLKSAGFPAQLLPQIVPAGTQVGETIESVAGITPGVKVYVAVGDAQCSVMSTQLLIHQAGTVCYTLVGHVLLYACHPQIVSTSSF